VNIKYGIIAVTKKEPESVGFFAGFYEQPNQEAYLNLYHELESDERYGFVGKKFYLLPASEADIKTFETLIEQDKMDANT